MGARFLESGLELVASEPEEQTDLSLIARVGRRDAVAVGQLYARYHDQVRAFARRLVGDRASAEDLVHDVFVALPRAAARYRGESGVWSFLLSIAINHSKSHLRTAMRRRKTLESFERETPSIPPTPDGEVERRELAHKLSLALDALPLDQRVAFVLCEVEERSSSEVALLLALPEGTVRSRLFHARRKLQAHFAAEDA